MKIREAMRLARRGDLPPAFEQSLKWIALALAFASALAIVQDWYPMTMFLSLPFCLIWIYCAWLQHRTPTQMDQHFVFGAVCLRHRALVFVVDLRAAANAHTIRI